MDTEVIDRRVDARFEPPPQAEARATLRPGCRIALIDVSAGGTLIEAPRPLRPGASVHLQVTTAGRRLAIGAHVLRCAVWALDPLDGVTYRGALKFEHRIEWWWAEPTRCVQDLPEHIGPIAPDGGNRLPENRGSRHAASAK